VIESLLEGLTARPDGALVAQLAREPGRRDSRWVQLFEEIPEGVSANETPIRAEAEATPARSAGGPDLATRVAALEQAVADLREELARMRPGP
jgi:hypothetical protein